MKKIIFGILFFSTVSVFSQDKLITRTGFIQFVSADAAFDNVKAQNSDVTCVLNTKTGEIASLALVKQFKFKIALMEEHFNETYVESDTYPKAVFKGLIENFDIKQLTATPKDFTLNGTLELHGKTVPIKTKLQIKKTAAEIQITGQFMVISTDFNMKIPSLGKKSITNGIDTSVKFVLPTTK